MIFRDLKGFTLVEVLITLGVIGVVSAVTLPTFISKIKDEQYDRARQKALGTIGEAVRLVAVDGDLTSSDSAKDFVEKYLSKKLKIVKTCEGTNLNNLEKCGLSKKITILGTNTKIDMPRQINQLGPYYDNAGSTIPIVGDKPSFGFVLSNGYSINLFYNPNCKLVSGQYDACNNVCFSVIYDMNGLHAPNEVGKDIGFITGMYYPDNQVRVVAPNPAPVDAGMSNWYNAQQLCETQNKLYSLPDKDELLAIAYNEIILNISDGYTRWSSNATIQGFHPFALGNRYSVNKTSTQTVRCIKR